MSRIVAGRYGGRRLTMPGTATRPTTDRVREALFSAVAVWAGGTGADPAESLAGLGFCDLFAGSGAIGLEAASRGAAPVLLVEGDRRTAATTRANVESLGAAVELRVASVQRQLAVSCPTPYDVVFADPPYAFDESALTTVLDAVVEHDWLAADGLLVVERSRRTPGPRWPVALAEGWQRTYGETVLHFRVRPRPHEDDQ